MRQEIADKLSQEIHDWRDAETILLAEMPFMPSGDDFFKVKQKHVGLRILIASKARRPSLPGQIEMLLTELFKHEALQNADCIDYIEILRCKADSKKNEVVAVELVEKKEKQKMWVGE